VSGFGAGDAFQAGLRRFLELEAVLRSADHAVAG